MSNLTCKLNNHIIQLTDQLTACQKKLELVTESARKGWAKSRDLEKQLETAIAQKNNLQSRLDDTERAQCLNTYEGWKNWGTWRIYSWLTDTEDDYQSCIDMAREALADPSPTTELAQSLESFVTANIPPRKNDPKLLADILNAAIKDISWREIAVSFLGPESEVVESEEAYAESQAW